MYKPGIEIKRNAQGQVMLQLEVHGYMSNVWFDDIKQLQYVILSLATMLAVKAFSLKMTDPLRKRSDQASVKKRKTDKGCVILECSFYGHNEEMLFRDEKEFGIFMDYLNALVALDAEVIEGKV